VLDGGCQQVVLVSALRIKNANTVIWFFIFRIFRKFSTVHRFLVVRVDIERLEDVRYTGTYCVYSEVTMEFHCLFQTVSTEHGLSLVTVREDLNLNFV